MSSGKKKNVWLKRFAWLAAVGILAIAVWCGTLYSIIVRFDGIPNSGTPVQADVGIVLGATLWNDKPSPGLQERLDHALTLYRQGAFKQFIVTGGLDDNGATLTEAAGMRNYLVLQGVPEADIALDTESRSTYENLLFAKAIMDKRQWKSAVIVTHRYHGSRAGSIAKQLGYSPVQVSVTDSKVLKLSYHKTREVLAYTKWLLDKARMSFG
ncbi:YdcF family protein [Cohnella faecalis]|uniref:YdcF family protein n=2 Tax=Cohnella faecalis TaxID=2315694 RepID=A0A398CRT8_9BACL|nr:YdcF family protein [Cohnella faecalis]